MNLYLETELFGISGMDYTQKIDFQADTKLYYGLQNLIIIYSTLIQYVYHKSTQGKSILKVLIRVNYLETQTEKTPVISGKYQMLSQITLKRLYIPVSSQLS